MNAPFPRSYSTTGSTTDGQGVIAREIQVPSRTLMARRPRWQRRRRGGQRDSDRVVHNHATERWMVSYADFITLLFAFFVVMYAVSSVNEGRYRVLSGALSTAFSPADGSTPAIVPQVEAAANPTGTAVPAPVAGETKMVATEGPKPVPEEIRPPGDPIDRAEVAKTAERVQHMTQLATRVDERLQSLVRNGQVHVTRGARGVAIEINAAVLFDPAKADLKPASFETLRTLASVLGGFVEPLQVEGHSDDVPIATREFRSNWELSAARAASVARFLIDQGVAPNRVGIAGYAEFRPLTANVTSVSRARNRRVTLLVLSADDSQPKEGGAPIAVTDAGSATP